jgi:hypothetical protein
MKRRHFLSTALFSLPILSSELLARKRKKTPRKLQSPSEVEQGLILKKSLDTMTKPTRSLLEDILQTIKGKPDLVKMPTGKLMAMLGTTYLMQTPYVGGTLEGDDNNELCRVKLEGLDCVTFFESVLCISRCIKKAKLSVEDVVSEVIYTRYRDGVVRGYDSRLHYTSDWIKNNIKKKAVVNVTEQIAPTKSVNLVSFMSANPQFYKQLKADPVLVKSMAEIEKEINNKPLGYIPKQDLTLVKSKLQTGDIIAIATSKSGLDYAHTGIIFVDESSTPRLLHASLSKKKVILDTDIQDYLNTVPSHIGITVVRPV